MRPVDADALVKTIESFHCKDCNNYNGVMCRACEWMDAMDYIEDAPTVDAQPVKHGHWSECYRDCRCISVICSVCKNPTAIAHGCRDADEVTMDYVIERLPHCPKCCSEMGGDANDW